VRIHEIVAVDSRDHIVVYTTISSAVMRPNDIDRSEAMEAMEDADACACATSRHIARLLTQLYDHFLCKAGVEAPQFALMVAIDKEERSHQSAIGRQCAMDRTTVSRNLKLLERKGWVTSTRGRDRRERHVTLTREGRKRLAAGWPEWRKAQNYLRGVMTGEEWTGMFHALQIATHAAQAAHRKLAARGGRTRS
jgi:DNA-binding MarR family transcriptional regulator